MQTKKRIKASREWCSALALHTSVGGAEAWPRLHASHGRGTPWRMFRVRRGCMNPTPAKDVSQVRLAIMQREEKWKATMSELGGGAKIQDLWRNVGSVGNMSNGCEGAGDEEAGRDRREQ